MIEINISELEEEAKKYLQNLMDNKGQELHIELIKFLRDCYWLDSKEYAIILEFINAFFVYQPERLNEKTVTDGSDSLNSMVT